MLNLDTHVLLFALAGDLTRHEKRVLSKHRWGISSIVLWEIAKLHQKGRITVSLEDPDIVQALDQMQIWPISREVCLNVPRLDFTSDPAGELIAATSLTYGVPLVTRDQKIRTSKLIQFL